MEKVLQIWLALPQNLVQCRYGQIVIIKYIKLTKFTEQDEKVITTHKEESQARLILDQEDRAKLQKFMSTCIHHFYTSVKKLCKVEVSSWNIKPHAVVTDGGEML